MTPIERGRIEALLRNAGMPMTYADIRDCLGSGLASTLMVMVQTGLVIEHPGTPKRFSLR